MVSAAVFAAVLYHPSSPFSGAISNELVRRALMGLAMGLTAVAIIYSPWGQRSGAHMNPAVTLTFFRLGKVARPDFVGYVAAQFTGAIVGIAAAAVALGGIVSHPSVNYVTTLPGPAGDAVAFVAEGAISFVLMLTVLTVSNHPRLAPFTGVCAGLLVWTYITVEARCRDEHEPGADVRIGAAGARFSGPLDLLHGSAAWHADGRRAVHAPLRRAAGSSAPSCTTLTTDPCIFGCGDERARSRAVGVIGGHRPLASETLA